MTQNPFRNWALACLERLQRRRTAPYGRAARTVAAIVGFGCVGIFIGSLWFAHEAPDFYILYIPFMFGSALGAVEFLFIALTGKDSGGWALFP